LRLGIQFGLGLVMLKANCKGLAIQHMGTSATANLSLGRCQLLSRNLKQQRALGALGDQAHAQPGFTLGLRGVRPSSKSSLLARH
jgi:hypothetical protein